MVVDLRVTQVVNQVLGVHAVLRDDALRERAAPSLARARRETATGFGTRPPASPCAGRTRESGSSRRRASATGRRRCPTRRSTRRSRLALVPEPTNEHDPNAVAIWNAERTLQLGYVPAAVAPELAGDEQALSLWRVDGGLRVLIVPADAWLGTPRR